VRAGTVEFLLASDIGRESELPLLYRRLVPDCSVLQLAHHGSSASTSRQFLDVARPELAVISVGENNFGHPGEDVLERLSATPVYRTDLNGTVEFITDGAKLWVKTGR
jgi:competence protein ComEC